MNSPDFRALEQGDDMPRIVQFSDVVTVEDEEIPCRLADDANENGQYYTTSMSKCERPTNFPQTLDSRVTTASSESEDSSDDSDTESTFVTQRGRGRRQSLAAQLLMAPSKWAQQKDYRQRKMSLHGKPIYFTAPSRRKNKLRKLKILIFNFLERPGSRNSAILYHVITFLLVLSCLVLTVFATIPEYTKESNQVLFLMEIMLVTLFSIELVARIWSAGCRVRYQGIMGRLRFARKPFCVIDIAVVIASYVIILAENEGHMFAATAMRGLRFLQILRMVRVDRRGGTWKLLGSVVYAHSKELITAWYIGFLALIFASFLVYQAEKEINTEQFNTFADALWWGLITLTTIGYGDKAPVTWVGRLITCCFAILGISFFALPAGILGSGFALKVQEQHRQKHFARRRNPAAYLIQCAWRCYAADADSSSMATWQPSLRAYITYHQPSQGKKTIRDKILGAGTPSSPKSKNKPGNNNDDVGNPGSYEDPVKDDFVKSALERLQGRLTSMSRQNSTRYRGGSDKKESYDNVDLDNATDDDSSTKSSEAVVELTEQQKDAIRAFRMMKFLVAKSKFKEALRPYDVKDVIEQYSSGHIDMLARVKNLQSRVDTILGVKNEVAVGIMARGSSFRSPRVKSPIQTPPNRWNTTSSSVCDLLPKNTSMNERLINVEKSVFEIEKKMDLMLSFLTKREGRKNGSECEDRSTSETDDQNPDDNTDLKFSKRKKFRKSFSNVKIKSPGLSRKCAPIGDTNELDEVPARGRMMRAYDFRTDEDPPEEDEVFVTQPVTGGQSEVPPEGSTSDDHREGDIRISDNFRRNRKFGTVVRRAIFSPSEPTIHPPSENASPVDKNSGASVHDSEFGVKTKRTSSTRESGSESVVIAMDEEPNTGKHSVLKPNGFAQPIVT